MRAGHGLARSACSITGVHPSAAGPPGGHRTSRAAAPKAIDQRAAEPLTTLGLATARSPLDGRSSMASCRRTGLVLDAQAAKSSAIRATVVGQVDILAVGVDQPDRTRELYGPL